MWAKHSQSLYCRAPLLASLLPPLTLAVGLISNQAPRAAIMNEMAVRRHTEHTVSPSYPAGSLARKTQGVAVAAIRIATDGKIATCTILEAPDEEIGSAVIAAVRQWIFQPIKAQTKDGDHPVTVDSKLTFYFRIDANGVGTVSAPEPVTRPTSAKDAKLPQEVDNSRAEKELLGKAGVVVLDIRTRDEFKAQHRSGAINIPLIEVDARRSELTSAKRLVIDCYPHMVAVCKPLANNLAAKLPADIYVLIR